MYYLSKILNLGIPWMLFSFSQEFSNCMVINFSGIFLNYILYQTKLPVVTTVIFKIRGVVKKMVAVMFSFHKCGFT